MKGIKEVKGRGMCEWKKGGCEEKQQGTNEKKRKGKGVKGR